MKGNKYFINISLTSFALLFCITILGLDNKQVIVTKYSDTIKCEKSDNYIFNYLQISYSDKLVEKKMNIFFLFNNVIENVGGINDLFIKYKSYDLPYLIKLAKDSIQLNCGESLSLIDHTYEVKYDTDDIVCIKHEWIPQDAARSTIDYYTLDLRYGDYLLLDSVIQINKQVDVCQLIKNKIETTLKYDLEINKDDVEYKENLALRKVEYDQRRMRQFIITNNNNIDGIQFLFSYYYPQAVSCYKPIFDLFFSFEELKPYMTEEFRQRIFPDK